MPNPCPFSMPQASLRTVPVSDPAKLRRRSKHPSHGDGAGDDSEPKSPKDEEPLAHGEEVTNQSLINNSAVGNPHSPLLLSYCVF